ncbi:MAG: efflux RND transporter periplasmic adaptor subunit, partial [Bryobacteraceae bacterium]
PAAQGLAVPPSCVLSFAGIERVLIVEGGALAERVVRPGRRLASGRVQIVEGVKAGDRVVVAPAPRLAAGQKVAVAGS